MFGILQRVALAALLAIASLGQPFAAHAEQFRVALSTKDFGYLPLFVGMRAGLFAQENLEIQWIVVNSNVVVTALLAGEIDVAGIAGSSMRAAARGAPLKANFFPYDKSLFVLMGAPNIKRVQDLKGKVIGTTGPGATTEVAASMVLAASRHGPEKRCHLHDHRRRRDFHSRHAQRHHSGPRLQSRRGIYHEKTRLHRARRARRHGALALGGLFNFRCASGQPARQAQTLDPRHGEEPAADAQSQRRDV